MTKFDMNADTAKTNDTVRELNLAELDQVGGGLAVGAGAGVSVTGVSGLLGGVTKEVNTLVGDVGKALGGIKL